GCPPRAGSLAGGARERARECLRASDLRRDGACTALLHPRVRRGSPDGEIPRPLRGDPAAAALPRCPRGARGRARDRERERESRDRRGRRARAVGGRARAGAGVTQTTESEPAAEPIAGLHAPWQCQSYLRATEHAALRAARWLGRADQEAAEESAAEGMRSTLGLLAINGRVVFGSSGGEGGLVQGTMLGTGGPEVDLALDPLEGRGVVARGGNGAMSMIAVGEPGPLMALPDMYMRKLAVGPRARG